MHEAVESLLRDTHLDMNLIPGRLPVQFVGAEPAYDTPHYIVAATAAALGAQACAVETLWRHAGGKPQQITVDLVQAAASLCPSRHQRQSGFSLPMMSGTELKHDFHETLDGRWFYPIGSYPAFRNGTLELLSCANTSEAIGRAIRQWKAQELEDEFAKRRLVGVYVRSSQEWAAHPQGISLAVAPVVSVERTGDSSPVAPIAGPRPLSRVRVLDGSHVIAGPIVARTLAEQGAEVLRVGAPHHVDPLLQIMNTNLGKRSAFLDLRDAAGRKRFKELVSEADVFVESWRLDSLDRLGLGADELHKLNPSLVHVSVSSYGRTGPWATRGGYEEVGQAVSGICHAEGECGPSSVNGRPKLVPTHFLNDYLTGYLGAVGASSALAQRAVHGGGYRVHVSLTRTSMWVRDLGVRPVPTSPIHPRDIQPVLEARTSPFGVLEHLPPVAEFSETPSRWDLPPTPLGASEPVWNVYPGNALPH